MANQDALVSLLENVTRLCRSYRGSNFREMTGNTKQSDKSKKVMSQNLFQVHQTMVGYLILKDIIVMSSNGSRLISSLIKHKKI